MKKIKRFLCVFLSLLLLIDVPSLTSLAAGDDEITAEATESTTEEALDEAAEAVLDEAAEATLDFSEDAAIAEESDGEEVTIEELTEAETEAVDVVDANEKATVVVTASANKPAATIGSTVVITAKASGTSGTVSYQWYMSSDGQTWKKTSLSGNSSNKLTYEATSGLFVYSFRCTVKDGKGTYNSNVVSVSKAEKPIVKATPSKKAAVPGTEVTITASAANTVGTASFQWYFSNDGGQTWKKTQLDGNATKKLTFIASAGLLAYSYRVGVTDANGVWYSDPVSILKASNPTITVRPSSPAAIYGTPVTITANVSNTTGTVSYQWYMSNDGENWKKTTLEGSATKTLSFEASSGLLAYSYRIQVKDDAGIWYSDPVKIAKGEKPSITAKANKVSAFIGDAITITANVTNANGTVSYQWYTSADGQTWKKTTLTGATTKTLSFEATAGLLSYAYRVQVKDDLGYWYSDPVTFRKAEVPIVKATARKDFAEAGETVSINVVPTNTVGTVTYQWYVSTDGENWKKTTLSGCKTATLSFKATAALLKNYYRVGVKDSNGIWYSNSVKIKNVTANVTVPVVTATKTSITDKKQANFDWGTNGDLTIKWSAENGNGKYNVEAYLMNDVPKFGTTQSYVSVVKNVQNVKTASMKLTTDDMKKARYLKVKISAQDKFYSYNGRVQTIEFSIRFARHIAVIVANDYAGTSNELKGPVNDLTAMAGMLEGLNQGWEVHKCPNNSATQMKDNIATYFSDTTSADICLFYYSGHGVDGGVGNHYNGALCGQDGSFLFHDQLESAISASAKGKVILLLDSCFSGATINATKIYDKDTFKKQANAYNQSVMNAFANVTYETEDVSKYGGEFLVEGKYYVITACAQDQTSLDSSMDGYSGGLFTTNLVKGVGGVYPNGSLTNDMPADANGDKKFTLGEIRNYVAAEIAKMQEEFLSEAYEKVQYWWDNNVLFGYVNGEPYTVQEYFDSFEEFYDWYVDGMYDQVTSTFGSDSFVMYRR